MEALKTFAASPFKARWVGLTNTSHFCLRHRSRLPVRVRVAITVKHDVVAQRRLINLHGCVGQDAIDALGVCFDVSRVANVLVTTAAIFRLNVAQQLCDSAALVDAQALRKDAWWLHSFISEAHTLAAEVAAQQQCSCYLYDASGVDGVVEAEGGPGASVVQRDRHGEAAAVGQLECSRR